jgi:hypothetical protein
MIAPVTQQKAANNALHFLIDLSQMTDAVSASSYPYIFTIYVALSLFNGWRHLAQQLRQTSKTLGFS